MIFIDNNKIKEVFKGDVGIKEIYIGDKMIFSSGGSESSEIPSYYELATDDDFSGDKNGSFRYIGTKEYIILPEIIKGIALNRIYGIYGMFENNTTIKGVAMDNPNISNAGNAFSGVRTDSLDLTWFNSSSINIMSNMFKDSEINNLILSNFDTSNVYSMDFMFYGIKTDSLDLSSFNIENVSDIWYMFMGSEINSLNLSSFNTSNISDMAHMFNNSKINNLDLSNFDTSNVYNMTGMFKNADVGDVLDLSSFDTLGIYFIESMFENCSATTGYARTQFDADNFNSSLGKPSTLTFIVKP